jgi:hypothetical protein
MANREVFSWREGVFFFGSAGGLVEQAYVENVSLSIENNWVRLRTHWPTAAEWEKRGTFILGDRDVSVEFGQMISDASILSFAFSASAPGMTAAWSISSGVMSYSHDGQDGDMHRGRAMLRALNVSATGF